MTAQAQQMIMFEQRNANFLARSHLWTHAPLTSVNVCRPQLKNTIHETWMTKSTMDIWCHLLHVFSSLRPSQYWLLYPSDWGLLTVESLAECWMKISPFHNKICNCFESSSRRKSHNHEIQEIFVLRSEYYNTISTFWSWGNNDKITGMNYRDGSSTFVSIWNLDATRPPFPPFPLFAPF